ncbi:hypothetical protein MUO32_06495 [Shinella sp. CPCC 101442]|uniref:hypothetical protein n=1 Tax=Shinella sp. CPCC 101442 TaxID=2932265 RepID=UPI00215265A2|nr:hypothetical protein [Shinella sp. CPCC 101442]MCR6498670.1 hypothetical protein [Shinella sp. CPCC 101442]
MPDENSRDDAIETPRGPQGSGGIPDRKQEEGVTPPLVAPDDQKNPNDPPLPFVPLPGATGGF